MTIKIIITNSITNEVVVNNVIEVPNDYSIFKANHKCMAEAFPDCEVTFEQLDGESFASTKALNQIKDYELVTSCWMSYEDYAAKWYSHVSE